MAARRIPRTSQSLSSLSSATVYRHYPCGSSACFGSLLPPVASTPAVIALSGQREHHKGAPLLGSPRGVLL